jgi:hypothetical protein
MAVSILTPSELEHWRLRGTKAKLDQRWAELSKLLNTALGRRAREIGIDADFQAAGVWTGLRGDDVERIDRNRGTASVIPLMPLPRDLSAWLGYQEVWDMEGGRAPFTFRQASLTIHIGEIGDPLKPQLLRLEWSGLRDWYRSGIGFQTSGAGHPHWQIDVFESLHDRSRQIQFDPDTGELPETFSAHGATSTVWDRMHGLTFERMHLASAAPWWLSGPAKFELHHLNAPANQGELSRWLTAAIGYIKQELSRCEARR